MKITFIIGNLHSARMDAVHGGFQSTPLKRCVSILLTEYQIRQLGLKKVGTDGGEDKYEEIVDVFLDADSVLG